MALTLAVAVVPLVESPRDVALTVWGRGCIPDGLPGMRSERKPCAKAIQQLVTAWKILRKWKWR